MVVKYFNLTLPTFQELFIQYLAQESLINSNSAAELRYEDLAEIVDKDQRLEFLRGTQLSHILFAIKLFLNYFIMFTFMILGITNFWFTFAGNNFSGLLIFQIYRFDFTYR